MKINASSPSWSSALWSSRRKTRTCAPASRRIDAGKRVLRLTLGIFCILAFLIAAPHASPDLSAGERLCKNEDPPRKPRKKKKNSRKPGAGREGKVRNKKETKPQDSAKIAKRKKAIQKLKRKIKFDSSSERRRAIAKIKKLKEHEQKDFLPMLRKLLTGDSDPLLREAVAALLGKLKDKGAEDPLILSLKDESDDVRMAAVRALVKLESTRSENGLSELVRKQDFAKKSNLLEATVRALGKLKFKKPLPVLRARLKDEATHHEVKLVILLYLGDVKDDGSYDYLLKTARDDDARPQARAYAANSLGRLGNKKAISPLRGILKELRKEKNSRKKARYSQLKIQITAALIRLGDNSVYGELVSASRDDDPAVRARAVRQMGDMKLKKARELLCFKYRNDVSRKVRGAAKKAIYKIDGRKPNES